MGAANNGTFLWASGLLRRVVMLAGVLPKGDELARLCTSPIGRVGNLPCFFCGLVSCVFSTHAFIDRLGGVGWMHDFFRGAAMYLADSWRFQDRETRGPVAVASLFPPPHRMPSQNSVAYPAACEITCSVLRSPFQIESFIM